MKKSTLSKLGMLVAGGWLASGVGWAAPPDEGSRVGGIPRCEAELLQCQADLAETQAFPATGQTTCWYFDDATQQYVADPECTDPLTDGQDGDIRAGAELSYTDTGLTIIDNNTKLEWMKQDDNDYFGTGTQLCESLGYPWGGDYPGNLDKDCTFTWDGAFAFVSLLNAANHAGHSDWRVPNYKELVSILNLENLDPAVSEVFHDTEGEGQCVELCTVDACSCTAAADYWSSTSVADFPGFAWDVSFNNGGVGGDGKVGDRRVRAVRGGL